MPQPMPEPMHITLNGEALALPRADMTVLALLEHSGMDPRKVAVERNRLVVPRSQHATTLLCEGDAIELVHFIGGG